MHDLDSRVQCIFVQLLSCDPELVIPGATIRETAPSPLTNNLPVPSDLGMDSLDHVQLVMALEEAFNIDLSREAFEGCKTVRDVVALVAKASGN